MQSTLPQTMLANGHRCWQGKFEFAGDDSTGRRKSLPTVRCSTGGIIMSSWTFQVQVQLGQKITSVH